MSPPPPPSSAAVAAGRSGIGPTPDAAPAGAVSRGLIVLLGILAAFGPMSIDMYLPSLPSIAQDFSVPVSAVQFTLSAFFLGFAGGQLVYGPLSDRFGRRPVLLVGISGYILTSAMCALSGGVVTMAAARLVQALGGGAASVIARAVVRDLFDADEAARVMSLMVMVTGLAPLFAPLVGGQILLWMGWRAIFWVLTAFGAACLLAVALGVPETNPRDRRRPMSLAAMAAGYAHVLGNRQATGAILAGGMAFAGMFAYISGTPFVYIELFGVPAQLYGLLFGLNIVGMMIGAYLNSRLVTRLGSRFMLGAGTLVVALAGLTLLGAVWLRLGGLLGIVVPLFFYVGTLNLISANAVARTLQHFSRIAGTAAALYGATGFALGSLSAALVGLLADGTALPMAAIIAICGVLSLAAERLLARD